MGIFTFSIPQEEKKLLIAKIHWSNYLIICLKLLIAGLLLAVILTFSQPFWWEGHWGRIGVMFFIAGAVIYAIFDFWKRFLTTYIITQCRLIDITQEKIFRRIITEVVVEEAEEIIIKNDSWLDKIFKKGDLIIKLKDKKGVLVFYSIKNPEIAKKILEGIKEETTKIVDKKGEECSVILKDNKTHNVPLSYSYYGEKAEIKKDKDGLIIAKKKKKEEDS